MSTTVKRFFKIVGLLYGSLFVLLPLLILLGVASGGPVPSDLVWDRLVMSGFVGWLMLFLVGVLSV